MPSARAKNLQTNSRLKTKRMLATAQVPTYYAEKRFSNRIASFGQAVVATKPIDFSASLTSPP